MQVCVLGVDKERAGFIPLAVKETRGSTPVKKLSVDSFLLSVTIPPCSSSETREGEGGEGEKGENQGVNERERGREEKKQAGEEESKKKGKEKKSKEIKKETKKRDREVQGGVCEQARGPVRAVDLHAREPAETSETGRFVGSGVRRELNIRNPPISRRGRGKTAAARWGSAFSASIPLRR
ncbi:uncharacterized protein CIMG_02695 [Coccidioides immitis RS]|uniref:Uncharacterized protein n=1 Tax=Coccidioides immitis (strain RS) TaxID=246410 RepID=J3KLX2_COCIM|nr:uncharacterized protein CIMG_02695 [Coccidioides immitis RS]EAS37341.3 hypothetical protein CIMG_02695 [Coccidioides immitis RS]